MILFIEIQGFTAEAAAQAVEFYRERYRTLGMFENHVIPGIPELLESLRAKGFELYVATSKPIVFAEEILRHYELDGFFKYAAGSNLDGTRSKKREVIQHVLEENNLLASQSLMIGDREHDIIGAKSLRCSFSGRVVRLWFRGGIIGGRSGLYCTCGE
ncbi:HAD hydrolase-like protein [Paenibacillus rhizoplanae]